MAECQWLSMTHCRGGCTANSIRDTNSVDADLVDGLVEREEIDEI